MREWREGEGEELRVGSWDLAKRSDKTGFKRKACKGWGGKDPDLLGKNMAVAAQQG